MVFPFVDGLHDCNRCKVQSVPKRRDRQRRAAASQEFFLSRSDALARKNCEKPPFDGKRRVRQDLHRIRLRFGSPLNGKARCRTYTTASDASPRTLAPGSGTDTNVLAS